MGKFTGKPDQFDGKNHGFRLRFSQENQSNDTPLRKPWLSTSEKSSRSETLPRHSFPGRSNPSPVNEGPGCPWPTYLPSELAWDVGIYPLVMTNIDMDYWDGLNYWCKIRFMYLPSGFTYEKWWCSIVMLAIEPLIFHSYAGYLPCIYPMDLPILDGDFHSYVKFTYVKDGDKLVFLRICHMAHGI